MRDVEGSLQHFDMIVGISRRHLDELHHSGIPVLIILVMVRFLLVDELKVTSARNLRGSRLPT